MNDDMTQPRIRKVVFPVGGLGTRFLPATKSMPKEMLPVVDKPLIHYAFEEARDAGIEQFIFVTGRNKDAISNHFDHSYELQTVLNEHNKTRELEHTSGWLTEPGAISFIRQQEPLGLGHAIWCARHAIGDEPFAVILADDLVLSRTPCIGQMIAAMKDGAQMLAVQDVPRAETSKYGIVDGVAHDGALVSARALVEKPKPENAPSTLAIIGRYILQPTIFDYLERQSKGAGGEIQLTDAISASLEKHEVYGYRFEGTRFDCGDKAGFIEANIAFALENPLIRDRVWAYIETITATPSKPLTYHASLREVINV
jgi:UTP--glucose-1-phosphate uridylyltransferase